MGPVAIVFFVIPAALRVVDQGLKGLVWARDQHRADKRLEEVGEQKAPPTSLEELDDSALYPICIDAVVPGRVLKELNNTPIWQDVARGVERAQLDKQTGEVPICEACGRFAMN
jgi:hypothetical protein